MPRQCRRLFLVTPGKVGGNIGTAQVQQVEKSSFAYQRQAQRSARPQVKASLLHLANQYTCFQQKFKEANKGAHMLSPAPSRAPVTG